MRPSNSQSTNIPGFHGAGFDPQQPGREHAQEHAQGFGPRPSPPPFSGSPIDGLPPFQRPQGQQEAANRFANAAQAMGDGARAAWQHLFGNAPNASGPHSGMPPFNPPQFGTPQFGMPNPWAFSSPYGPRYANNMQPGMMPSMGPLRTMNAILSGAMGLAIGAFDPIAGLLAGLGMFAESEMSAGIMRNMMTGFNLQPGTQQGGNFGTPFVMPWILPPSGESFPGAHFGTFANDWMTFMPTLATMMFLQNAYQGAASNPMGPAPTAAGGQYGDARFATSPGGQSWDTTNGGVSGFESDAESEDLTLPPWNVVFQVSDHTTQQEVTQKYLKLHKEIMTGEDAEHVAQHVKEHALSQLSERFREALEYFAEHESTTESQQ